MADSFTCTLLDGTVTFELAGGSRQHVPVEKASRSFVVSTAISTQDEDGRFLLHAPRGVLERWLRTITRTTPYQRVQMQIDTLQVLYLCTAPCLCLPAYVDPNKLSEPCALSSGQHGFVDPFSMRMFRLRRVLKVLAPTLAPVTLLFGQTVLHVTLPASSQMARAFGLCHRATNLVLHLVSVVSPPLCCKEWGQACRSADGPVWPYARPHSINRAVVCRLQTSLLMNLQCYSSVPF